MPNRAPNPRNLSEAAPSAGSVAATDVSARHALARARIPVVQFASLGFAIELRKAAAGPLAARFMASPDGLPKTSNDVA